MRQIPIVLAVVSLVSVVNGCAKSTTNDGPIAVAVVPTHHDVDETMVVRESALDKETNKKDPHEQEQRAPHDKDALPSCNLKAALRSVATAGSGTRFVLTLTNQGSKALQLVTPGDGSGEGWRTPQLTWSAKDTHGADVPRRPMARCGMMNSIEAREVFTLPPSATRELAEWISPPPFDSGTYELRLTYRNDPRIVTDTGKPVTKEVAELLAATAACETTSNAVHATIAN